MQLTIIKDKPSNQALILALLTAGGGITGYARTGSIPSIAAGVTVGALVIIPISNHDMLLYDSLLDRMSY